MAPVSENEAKSRETSPADLLLQKEQREKRSASDKDRIVRSVLRKMRSMHPGLYAAVKYFLEHGKYHGLHTDLGKRLGLTPNGAKNRLGKGFKWLAEQIQREAERRSRR